ncbi:MAG: hypothetical protein ABH832_02935 [bacterium]
MIKFFKKHFHLKYHGIYRHAKKLFAFDMALLALAIVMLGSSVFFMLWKPGITDMIDLHIMLGSGRIRSGDYVHITIDYLNRSEFQLSSTTLGLQLPNGFIVDRDKVTPEYFDNNSIFLNIDEVPAGGNGRVELYGWLWTDLNVQEKIIARLTYTPEDTKRKEQKLSHYLISLSDSALQSKLIVPSSTFINTDLQFDYVITNDSDKKIEKIDITTNLPETYNQPFADVFSLNAKETKKISGSIKADSKQDIVSIVANPRVIINNHALNQKTINAQIKIVRPSLFSKIEFPDQLKYVEPSTIAPIKLSWKNNSNFALQNLKMKIISSYPQIIDWKKTASENHLEYENNAIIISKDHRTSLSNGPAGAGDEFEINLYFKQNFNLIGAENARLVITPTISGSLGQIVDQIYEEQGFADDIPIATEISIVPEIRYYTQDGDQLGRGPLPPQVEKQTKYWAFVQINNTSNAIKDLVFNARLSNGIQPTDKQSVTIGSKITYNKTNNFMEWSLGQSIMPNSYVGLYFELMAEPNAQQINKPIKLIESFNITATDEFTQKKFNINISGLDNKLQKNDKGWAKGYLVSP